MEIVEWFGTANISTSKGSRKTLYLNGALSNPMFRLKGPLISVNGGFPAAFPLKHMQKDLRLALRLAEEVGQPLFATAIVNEIFKTALADGLGDADFAAVSRVIR